MTSPTDRRSFVATLAGSTAMLSLTACTSAAAGAVGTAPRASSRSSKWDDGWTERLGKHRTVFDVPDFDSQGVWQVAPVMDAFNEVLGTSDKDLGFVLIVRHSAIPMAFKDEIWAKYDFTQELKRKDPKTNETYKRNPYAAMITAAQARGVVVLGCHVAAVGMSNMLARRANMDATAVREEVMANLLPGVTLLPNGLYALARAQDVGCGFMR
jgi:hypothetical protein